MSTNLRFENGYWYQGCGCGGKPKIKFEVPDNSIAIQVFANGPHTGPVTGLKYNFVPHEAAIDVDKADAEEFIKQGKAAKHNGRQRGRLTRIIDG